MSGIPSTDGLQHGLSPPIGGAWLLVGLVLVAIVVLALGLVRYYSDPDSSHWFASLVFISCVVCSLLCIALIPIDVQFTSPYIKTSLLILLSCLIVLAFVMAPFAYFIVEDDKLVDIDDDEPSLTLCGANCDRICSAAKATAIFCCICMLLLFIGLLLDPARHRSLHADGATTAWMESFMIQNTNGQPGERALLLVIAVMTTIGFLNLVLYAGYGLAVLPISLIRGHKDVEEERLTIEAHWTKLSERRVMVERRAQGWSDRKRTRELAAIQAQLTRVGRQRDALQNVGRDCSYRCARAMAPFRSLIGLLLSLISMLIIISLTIALADRAMHSFCGFHCGFLLDASLLYNPLDHLLVSLAKYFPLDLLVLSAIALYLFLSTIYGVFKNGVRVAFEVFELKHKATWPQSMVIAGLVLLFSVLATLTVLTVMAPQYTAFGHQHFAHEHGASRHCHLTASFGRNISVIPMTSTTTTMNGNGLHASPIKDITLKPSHHHSRNLLAALGAAGNDDQKQTKNNNNNAPTHHAHNGEAAGQHHHHRDGNKKGEHSMVGGNGNAAPRVPIHHPGANGNNNHGNNNNNNNHKNGKTNSKNINGSTDVHPSIINIPSSSISLTPGMLLHGECRMSELSQMVTRMTVSLPFFAIASFFGSAAFIIVVIICALHHAFREKPSFYQEDMIRQGADDAIDHELRGLIPATI